MGSLRAAVAGALLGLAGAGPAAAREVVIPPLPAAELVIPSVSPPELVPRAGDIEAFVPRGWRLEAWAAGDLDRDGNPDAALVLRGADPANVLADTMCEKRFDTNPRILLILLAEAGGGYRRVARADELIPRRDNPCQVDAFSDPGQIAIQRGVLRIDLERMMSAGGWDAGTTTYRFRWRDGAMRLIGFDHSNVRRNSGAMTRISINYQTGRVKISTGNIGTDRETVRWRKLGDRRAPALEGIGDGLAFDPEKLVSSLP